MISVEEDKINVSTNIPMQIKKESAKISENVENEPKLGARIGIPFDKPIKIQGKIIEANIEISPNEHDVINIYEGDDINKLTSEFCLKHNVNTDIGPKLKDHIVTKLKEFSPDSPPSSANITDEEGENTFCLALNEITITAADHTDYFKYKKAQIPKTGDKKQYNKISGAFELSLTPSKELIAKTSQTIESPIKETIKRSRSVNRTQK